MIAFYILVALVLILITLVALLAKKYEEKK
jgi:hypothetical protein